MIKRSTGAAANSCLPPHTKDKIVAYIAMLRTRYKATGTVALVSRQRCRRRQARFYWKSGDDGQRCEYDTDTRQMFWRISIPAEHGTMIKAIGDLAWA